MAKKKPPKSPPDQPSPAIVVAREEAKARPEEHSRQTNQRLAEIPDDPPASVPPPIRQTYTAIIHAIRQAHWLKDHLPYLWNRPESYRDIAELLHSRVTPARKLYLGNSMTLIRAANGDDAFLSAVNDLVRIRKVAEVGTFMESIMRDAAELLRPKA